MTSLNHESKNSINFNCYFSSPESKDLRVSFKFNEVGPRANEFGKQAITFPIIFLLYNALKTDEHLLFLQLFR